MFDIPLVKIDDSIAAVQAIFDDENVAMVVENGEVTGVITKIDVVEFLAARAPQEDGKAPAFTVAAEKLATYVGDYRTEDLGMSARVFSWSCRDP